MHVRNGKILKSLVHSQKRSFRLKEVFLSTIITESQSKRPSWTEQLYYSRLSRRERKLIRLLLGPSGLFFRNSESAIQRFIWLIIYYDMTKIILCQTLQEVR